MKKVLLGLALVLGASSANAAGLYLSAGYGKADPDLKYSTKTVCTNPNDPESCVSGGSETYGNGLLDLPGFPNGKVLGEYNATSKIGLQASDWDAGLNEEYDYETKSSGTTAFAVGWDISQNPFRFELEYQRTKFKSPGYKWRVNDPQGRYFYGTYANDPTTENGYEDGIYTDSAGQVIPNCVNGICLNFGKYLDTTSYDFDINFYNDMESTVDAYMGNIYFEIPGFGPIDPYIGYGYGKAKVNFDFMVPTYGVDNQGNLTDQIVSMNAVSGGSDGYVNAKQLILGVEYRFDETPFIAGIEYRQFKVDFDERDEKDPYNLEHKYVMFKLRYDFISDEF